MKSIFSDGQHWRRTAFANLFISAVLVSCVSCFSQDLFSSMVSLQSNKLIDIIYKGNSEERAQAAYILGSRYNIVGSELEKPTLDALISATSDLDDIVRYQAVGALHGLGELGIKDRRASVPLIHALSDGNERVRYAAARALGVLGDDRAIDPLSNALKDAEPSVRSFSAQALGQLGRKSAIPVLAGALNDRDETVCSYVAVALSKLDPERGYGTLVLQLKSDLPNVRDAAAEALADLGDPRAIQPIGRALLEERNGCTPGDRCEIVVQTMEKAINKLKKLPKAP